MNRRHLIGLSASTFITAGCLGLSSEGASPTHSSTTAGSTPDSETRRACERENQYLPDISVENNDDLKHEITLTVRKRKERNVTIIFEEAYHVPKQSERTTEVAFEEPRTTSPDAEYRATATTERTTSTVETGHSSSSDVTSAVVIHPLRYGIKVEMDSNGNLRVMEAHVDGTNKKWSNICGETEQ